MAYGLEYRSEWKMMNDTDIIRVSIFDTDTITDDPPTVVNMVPSGNPLTISIIDNDKDKYKVIKSRQAKIEVLTSNEVGFETFADGHENKYRVEIRINPDGDNTPLLFGFLSLADNQEDFLPDPNVLVLTATDHLGMLKDIPMTMPSGAVPSGKSKMIDYISWCLRKTGLDLEIYAVNNLRHGSGNLANMATFSVSGNYFVMSGLLTDFFYSGQILTISGTTSNNGTFTVQSVDNTGLVTVVTLTTAITTAESATGATFTDDTSSEYFYDHYLDAKTFEDEIGTCEDCYQVIEKILGYDCFITQYGGRWWIFRIDEWDLNDIYVLRYTYDGTVVSFEAGTTYNKSVGRGETLSPVLADWLVTADRPHKFDKLTFTYGFPREIPCNIDFERGDYIADLPNVTIDDVVYTSKSYELDCWTLRKGQPPFATVDEDCYIVKRFNELNYENERFVEITYNNPISGGDIFLESSAIEIEAGDKFDFGYDFRWSQDYTAGSGIGNVSMCRVRIDGDDGSVWFLDEDGKWYLSDSTWSTNLKNIFNSWDPDDVDETEWIQFQNPITQYTPFPVSGNLYLMFTWKNNVEFEGISLNLQNLTFTYYPYINGSFTKYTGQYQRVTSSETRNIANVDDEVYISDSPKPILKGGIFRQISTFVFSLCNKWFPYNVFGLTLPQDGSAYAHPYGEVQIRSVFNQYRYANRIFTGSIAGLTDGWPDLIHKYTITDTNPNTTDRFFMLTSFEQNWKSGYMSGTWVEVYKEPGKGYSEDREFKYISQ